MSGRTHGLSSSRIYKIYYSMVDRCNNEKNKRYIRYGGRGIRICDEWLGKKGFVNFYNWSINNGYSSCLSIDRIDNDGNYCPQNCRWTDIKTQANNTSRNRLITYNGITKTMAEWSDTLGIPYGRLNTRLNTKNMSVEEAFNKNIMNNTTRKKDIQKKTEAFGESKYLYQWAEENNIDPYTITQRVNRGMSIEDAISRRKYYRMSKTQIENMFDDYYSGMAEKEIMEKYNISSAGICRYRQRYNKPPRNPKFMYENRKVKHGY